jgi:hypothetical protein
MVYFAPCPAPTCLLAFEKITAFVFSMCPLRSYRKCDVVLFFERKEQKGNKAI